MLAERIGDLLALVQLQRVLNQLSITTVVSGILIGALVVLIADYASMLYMHFKMVRQLNRQLNYFLTSV